MSQYDGLSFDERITLAKLSGAESLPVGVICLTGKRHAAFMLVDFTITKITKETTAESLGIINPEFVNAFNLIRRPLNDISYDFTYSSVSHDGDQFTLIAGDPLNPVLIWTRYPLGRNIHPHLGIMKVNVVYYGRGTINTNIAIEQLNYAARKMNERS